MSRLVLGFIALLPALLEGQQVKKARLIARIDSIAGKAMKEGRIPGLSIGVSRGKETILARGYGVASLEDSTPATAETVYPIASITKQFTAAAIMRLDEDDRVRLTDDFSRYLPTFPVREPKTTVQQLLNHTAGIPNTRPGDSSSNGVLDLTATEFLDRFGSLPRDFPPGEKFAYSNGGYYLLGLLIESVSGQPYSEFVRLRLFEPAGMASSGACSLDGSGHATGYDVHDSTVVRASPVTGGRLFAAAGLCSTVVDLLKWQRALRDRKVVNFFSWKQMTEPAELKDGSRASYGYGMTLGRLGKHRSVGHGGSVPGFSSQLTHYPDDDVTIAVLANSEQALSRRIADQIGVILLGVVEPKVKDIAVSPGELERYTGIFDLAGEKLEVYVAAGRLMMTLGGGTDGIRLLYQGSNEFAAEPDPATKLYFRLSGGKAASVVFRTGDLSLTAQRK
jgi:CubicO group peptidase (beta-lactamase class C family)